MRIRGKFSAKKSANKDQNSANRDPELTYVTHVRELLVTLRSNFLPLDFVIARFGAKKLFFERKGIT